MPSVLERRDEHVAGGLRSKDTQRITLGRFPKKKKHTCKPVCSAAGFFKSTFMAVGISVRPMAVCMCVYVSLSNNRSKISKSATNDILSDVLDKVENSHK